MELRFVLEAVLFVADKPLTPRRMLAILQEASMASPAPATEELAKLTEAEARAGAEALGQHYESIGSGLSVVEVAEGFQLRTRPSVAPWVGQMFDEPKANRLSPPALETLAIVAYRQPLTRAEIEAVRGVAVDGVVATLLERKLIRIAGRSDQPGRPLLYETTPQFLEEFGLKSLSELPNADELRRIQIRPAAAPNPDEGASGETAALGAGRSEDQPLSPPAASPDAAEPGTELEAEMVTHTHGNQDAEEEDRRAGYPASEAS